MSSGFLWLATLASVHLCVVQMARSETNAVIPYKAMSDLCQIASDAWCGKKIIGPSGFRFLRIDAIDPVQPVGGNGGA